MCNLSDNLSLCLYPCVCHNESNSRSQQSSCCQPKLISDIFILTIEILWTHTHTHKCTHYWAASMKTSGVNNNSGEFSWSRCAHMLFYVGPCCYGTVESTMFQCTVCAMGVCLCEGKERARKRAPPLSHTCMSFLIFHIPWPFMADLSQLQLHKSINAARPPGRSSSTLITTTVQRTVS